MSRVHFQHIEEQEKLLKRYVGCFRRSVERDCCQGSKVRACHVDEANANRDNHLDLGPGGDNVCGAVALVAANVAQTRSVPGEKQEDC